MREKNALSRRDRNQTSALARLKGLFALTQYFKFVHAERMHEEAPQPPSFLTRSWILFGGELISVPILLIGSAVLNPQNKPWTAFVVPPLFFLSLLCCVAAPFFNSLSRGKKFAFSIGALFAFAAVLLATLLYCADTFGTGIQ